MLDFATAGVAISQEMAWDMPNEYGETSISGESDKVFAERLAENSGDRIVVTNHFGGSLGYKSKDHWAAVEDSAVQIASTYTGVFAGFAPILLLNKTNGAHSLAMKRRMRSWPPTMLSLLV